MSWNEEPGSLRSAAGWALAGVGLGGLAVGLDAASLISLLDPAAAGARREALLEGVALLRVLLGADALILLGAAAWCARRPRQGGAGRRAVALWRPAPAEREPTPGVRWAVGLAVGLAALVARGIGLDWDLWMDEVGTLVGFVRRGFGVVLTDFSDDNQHVLYSLLACSSVAVLGEGAAALRLPALAFGLASLWALARLGRTVLSWREGVLAAALLAVSYHHVWFSQNARGYTLLLFATLLATELFLRGLARPGGRVWLGYAATVALGAWAHLTMVFVGIAHGLVGLALVVRDRSLRAGRAWPLLGTALAGWLTLHLYALVLPQLFAFFDRPGAGSTTRPVAWSSPLWLVTETLQHLGIGLAPGAAGLVAAAVVGGLGLRRCARRAPWSISLMLLPGVLEMAVMIALGRSLWPRFFFHLLGFAALIAMAGALEAGQALGRLAARGRPLLVALPALALVAVSAASLPRVYRYPKQDYTGTRDFVRSRLGPRDRVVALHMAGRVYHDYYARDWAAANSEEELEANRATAGRTWVLYTLPSYLEAAQPALMHRLETEFEHVRTFPGTLRDGEIVVLRSRSSAGGDPEGPAGRDPETSGGDAGGAAPGGDR